MREPRSFSVASVKQAAHALEYFNGFHDGFMKRIALTSLDEIDEDLGQSCTSAFEVEIDFAHYNYPGTDAPFHPHDQIIRTRFRQAQDVFLDLGSAFLGNTILNLSIVDARRVQGGSDTVERCLGLHLARHYYLAEHRRHELREAQLFTFTEATFEEVAP